MRTLPETRSAEVVEAVRERTVTRGITSIRVAGYKRVRDETGEIHNLVNGSTNGTNAPLGAKGTITYVAGSMFSLWYFEEDKE